MKKSFERMLRYVSWADQRSLIAIRDSLKAREQALPIMSHLLAAEHIWLSRLLSQPSLFAVWPNLSLEQCEQLAAENNSGFEAYVATTTEEQLMSIITFRTTAGQEYSMSALDILTQVVTHGSYHRGQIARILGQSGESSISTDFIVYTIEESRVENKQKNGG
ncbi:MAG: DinB family protein [Planctomycetaceae bacterium]